MQEIKRLDNSCMELDKTIRNLVRETKRVSIITKVLNGILEFIAAFTFFLVLYLIYRL